MRRHKDAEIEAKLAQAANLASQGMLQTEIARTLGVSVMTLHRWRKAASTGPARSVAAQSTEFDRETERVGELQVENSRLRKLVTDLLLERMKLEESVQGEMQRVRPSKSRTAAR
jgi:transposase-like protein